jgi:hypothetical protein
MNKDGALNLKKRSKRHFSQEDKKNFYIQWKASGLRRAEFCRKHDLTPSAFSKWCRQLHPNKPIQSLQNDWLPIVSKAEPRQEIAFIKVKIPNITHGLLSALFVILLIRGVLDAIAIIW